MILSLNYKNEINQPESTSPIKKVHINNKKFILENANAFDHHNYDNLNNFKSKTLNYSGIEVAQNLNLSQNDNNIIKKSKINSNSLPKNNSFWATLNDAGNYFSISIMCFFCKKKEKY
jgi:hypothetical protein